jgi:hypothetical protein
VHTFLFTGNKIALGNHLAKCGNFDAYVKHVQRAFSQVMKANDYQNAPLNKVVCLIPSMELPERICSCFQ